VAARSANACNHQGLEWFSQRTTGKIASGPLPGHRVVVQANELLGRSSTWLL